MTLDLFDPDVFDAGFPHDHFRRLRAEQLGDTFRALEAHREVLRIQTDHAGAVAALEAFLERSAALMDNLRGSLERTRNERGALKSGRETLDRRLAEAAEQHQREGEAEPHHQAVEGARQHLVARRERLGAA